tara:strand:+ start:847 stop:1035 length:189 start_codon:yes stop_codon:yes gene_type:complete
LLFLEKSIIWAKIPFYVRYDTKKKKEKKKLSLLMNFIYETSIFSLSFFVPFFSSIFLEEEDK